MGVVVGRRRSGEQALCALASKATDTAKGKTEGKLGVADAIHAHETAVLALGEAACVGGLEAETISIANVAAAAGLVGTGAVGLHGLEIVVLAVAGAGAGAADTG